jgi:WD40 repeat protein
MRAALSLVALASCSVALGADPPWLVARLGNDRFRQRETVAALTYSPDSKFLASADGDTIHIWDAADGRRTRSIPIKDHDFFALRYSADSRTLFAAGTDDRSTRLIRIDPTTGKVRSNVAVRAGKSEGVFSDDGGWLVVRPKVHFQQFAPRPQPNSLIHVVNLQMGNDWTDRLDAEVTTCVFAAARNVLAVGTDSGTIRTYDARTGKRLRDFSIPGRLITLLFSQNGGDMIAYIHEEKSRYISRLCATSGKLRWQYKTDLAEHLAFAGDGKSLVYFGFLTGRHDGLHWHWLDSETGKPTGVSMDTGDSETGLPFGCRQLDAVAWSHSSNLLAISASGGRITQWDSLRHRLDPISADPCGPVYDPRLTSDGKRVRGWTPFGWYEWDVKTGRQSRVPMPANLRPIDVQTFSRDWKWLLTRSPAQEEGKPTDYQVINSASGKKQLTIPAADAKGELHFLPNDRLAVSSGEGRLSVYDLTERKALLRIELGNRAGAVHFAPDGSCVAKVGVDENGGVVFVSFRRWNLETGEMVTEWSREVSGISGSRGLDVVAGLCFSPNGRIATFKSFWLVAPNVPEERTVAVDAATGRKLGDWTGSRSDGVVFTPDSRSVLVYDRQPFNYYLYEVATGECRRQFLFRGTSVSDFSFSPDGRRLIVATRPYPVEIWDVISDTGPWDAMKPDAIWESLSSANARQAYVAIRHLLAHPEKATAFLKERVKPPIAPDAAWVKEKLAGLEASQFRDREKATADLAAAGETVIVALREARKTASAEAQTRLKTLIEKAETMTPEKLRAIRVCEVLEGIGSAEAKALLAQWAKGPSAATLTREATESLERLKRRD